MRIARTGFMVAAIAALVWLSLPTAAGGRTAYVTTYGTSMGNAFRPGDLVVTRRAERYVIGDVVAYRSTELDRIVLHRVVSVDSTGYTVKGDTNEWFDPERPTQRQIIGRSVIRIPTGGLWLDRVHKPPAAAAISALLLISSGVAAGTRGRGRRERSTRGRSVRATAGPQRDRRRRARPQAERPQTVRPQTVRPRAVPSQTVRPQAARPRPERPQTVRDMVLPVWSPTLRVAAVAAAVIGLLGAALGIVAWTGGETAVPPPSSSPAAAQPQSMTFGYSATVPSTLAYDSTVVQAPEPIFRRLTELVEVSYRYQGRPGTIRVDALLSTRSGWHSSVQLAAEHPISESPFTGTVTMDLIDLSSRAEIAGAIIGLPARDVTVVVTAQVVTEDSEVFAPELALTLTPLQLVLAAESATDGALVVTANDTAETGIAADQAPARPMVGVLGRDLLPVSDARLLSAALIIIAVLAVGVVAGVARHSAGLAEADRIQGRYGRLIARARAVEPMAGQSIVEVSDFRTLARLAERYGLLIVRWSVPGSQRTNFAVQDDGTTYRYVAARRPDRRSDPSTRPRR